MCVLIEEFYRRYKRLYACVLCLRVLYAHVCMCACVCLNRPLCGLPANM